MAASLVFGVVFGAGATPFPRFPSASKAQIAFVAYDDLWVVPLHGGTGHRLLQNAGVITTPLFSPDGRWIAYTSRHGGLHDLFVISANRGQPKRLTYEASRFADGAMVVSWTPDSKRVIFLSHRATLFPKLVRAFSVPLTYGMAEQLPLDHAERMSFAPNGHQVAFNRVFRNLELRKRATLVVSSRISIPMISTHTSGAPY